MPGLLNSFGAFGLSIATAWDPAHKDVTVTLSGLNLTMTTSSGFSRGAYATTSHSTGKWYFSIHIDAATTLNSTSLGVTAAGMPTNQGAGFNTPGISYQGSGIVVGDGTNALTGQPGIVAGDTIGMAIDITNSLAYFSRNGTWLGTGDPVAGTGGLPIDAGQTWFPLAMCADNTVQLTINTGSPPTGFSAW